MATKSEWQGRVGREWADKAEALDLLLGPAGQAGIDTLGPLAGRRVLDLGSGAGQTAVEMAQSGARVVGVDVSEDLMAVARRRDKQKQVAFLLADAAQTDLPGPFDALYSRCGAMFFDDPVQGWTHLRAEVGPGCKLAVVCWASAHENDWARVPLNEAQPILGEAATQLAPPSGPGPFAWSRPETFKTILTEAGWKNLTWNKVEVLAEIGTGKDPDPVERAVAFCMRIGPLAGRLQGVDPELRDQIKARLRKRLPDYLQGGVVKLASSAWVIEGLSGA